MTYLILLIIILTLGLYFVYKDYLKVLKITSIVTILSGIFTFIVGFLIKYLMNINFDFIRISDVVNIIVAKFVFNGICLLVLGLVEFVLYFIFSYVFERKRKISSI